MDKARWFKFGWGLLEFVFLPGPAGGVSCCFDFWNLAVRIDPGCGFSLRALGSRFGGAIQGIGRRALED